LPLFSVFWAAGVRLRDVAIIALVGLLALSVLVMVKPYIRIVLETFFDPSKLRRTRLPDPPVLIAIGSGGLFGRGFGQAYRNYLSARADG